MLVKRIKYKRWVRIILALGIIASMMLSVACSQKTLSYADKEELLDAYVEDMFEGDYNKPSLSIMVIDGGEPVYTKSFGIANMDTMELASPETNYRIASLTKMFTSMSIMILRDRGLLDYDMYVSEILDDFPEYGKDITIRHLLEHTSGIGSYNHEMDVSGYNEVNQLLDSDVYDMIKSGESTYFEPGTIFRYSDTGYVLLGIIVEEISNTSLSDFMKENIFNPLAMDNTVAYDKRVDTQIVNRCYGAQWEVGKYVTKDQSFASAVIGDGGVYSSLEELGIWHKNLYVDSLVSKETLEESYKIRGPLDFGYKNCTCGLYIKKNVANQLEIMHDGGTQGFTSHFLKIPEKNQGMIILSNLNWYGAVCTTLPDKIREIYGFPKETPKGQQRY